MKHMIDDETIEYVGILAKLELSDAEKEQAKQDIEKMLDYMDRLGELDTEGVEPLSHVLEIDNVFREDIVIPSEIKEKMLGNAPAQKDGMFMVPKTLEQIS